ncbi:MAG: substrate-binding domain-containing protein [Chlorobium sp.]|jgi:phosphate transport system substrate-binding protein
MNKKALHHRKVRTFIRLFYLFSLCLFTACTQKEGSETARTGRMTFAVDRQLKEISATQIELFNRYYPDAEITLMPVSSAGTLKNLLNHQARAALISGELTVAEDSLFTALQPPLRREPVAREAIACITNRSNPLETLSIAELKTIFTGNVTGKDTTGFIPLMSADDFRLHSLFAAKIGIHTKNLHAHICSSEAELFKRVATDKKAVAVLFRSSLNSQPVPAIPLNDIKIIPVSIDRQGSKSYMPTQQNIFEGLYPLVTTVYYVYYSGDALAAGFGSWLGTSGRKVFETSSLAPFRSLERTIIMK